MISLRPYALMSGHRDGRGCIVESDGSASLYIEATAECPDQIDLQILRACFEFDTDLFLRGYLRLRTQHAEIISQTRFIALCGQIERAACDIHGIALFVLSSL